MRPAVAPMLLMYTDNAAKQQIARLWAAFQPGAVVGAAAVAAHGGHPAATPRAGVDLPGGGKSIPGPMPDFPVAIWPWAVGLVCWEEPQPGGLAVGRRAPTKSAWWIGPRARRPLQARRDNRANWGGAQRTSGPQNIDSLEYR